MSKSRSKRKFHRSASTAQHRPQSSNLTSARQLFFAITSLSTIMVFAAGLFAAVGRRDTVLTTITFCIAFVGLVLTVIQTYPRITQHIRGSWRVIMRLSVVLFVLLAIPASWLALQKPVIKIGISLPFSGGDKQDALPIFYAVKQAVDEADDQIGNYELQLVPFDDASAPDSIKLMSPETGQSPSRATNINTVMNDAQIAGIIGPFKSGTAQDEIPLTGAQSIPLLSPSATLGCLTQARCGGKDLGGKDTFFRTATTDAVRSKVLADFLDQHDSPAFTNVAIFIDGSSFGDGFAANFAQEWQAKHPGSSRLEPHPLTDDPGADLKALGYIPDLVLFAGTGPKGIALHETMQLNPAYTGAAFAGAATIMNGAFTGHLQDRSGGDIYAITPTPYDDTSNKIIKFTGDYKTANGGEATPTPYSASAYDTTKILLAAIRRATEASRPPVSKWDILGLGQAKAFRQKVIAKLYETNRGKGLDYDGITGTIKFTDSGDVDYGSADGAKNVSIYKYYSENQPGKHKGWNYEPFTLR